MSLRKDVLSIYKQIIRSSRQWKTLTSDAENAVKEQQYIINEARRLFNKNKDLKDEAAIKEHLKEAQTRLELALHYRTPYPRPMNFPQTLLPPAGKKLRKGQKRLLEQSKPVYLKSYDET